jgi:hypothetical protein
MESFKSMHMRKIGFELKNLRDKAIELETKMLKDEKLVHLNT